MHCGENVSWKSSLLICWTPWITKTGIFTRTLFMLHSTSWLILWIIFMPHDLQKKMAPVILQWLRYTWLGEKKTLDSVSGILCEKVSLKVLFVCVDMLKTLLCYYCTFGSECVAVVVSNSQACRRKKVFITQCACCPQYILSTFTQTHQSC